MRSNGRPRGIALSSVYLALVGFALLTFTFSHIESISEMMSSLSRSGVSLLLFVMTNVLSPLAMLVGGVGLWYRKVWGWWFSVLAIGAGLASILFMLLKIPPGMTVFISSSAIGSIIGILIIGYLVKPGLMAHFGFDVSRRAKAIKVAMVASILIGILVVALTPAPNIGSDYQEGSNKSFNKDAP